jgi:hypothetical protein
MEKLEQLTTGSAGNFAAAKNLFDAVNARLFLKFTDQKWGKRTLRKPASGVLPMGSQPPPITIDAGPTARRTTPTSKNRNGSLAGRRFGWIPSIPRSCFPRPPSGRGLVRKPQSGRQDTS